MSDEQMVEQAVDNSPFIPEEIYKVNWERLFKLDAENSERKRRFSFRKGSKVSGYVIFDERVKEDPPKEEAKPEDPNAPKDPNAATKEEKKELLDYAVFKGRIDGSRMGFRVDFETCKIAFEKGILRAAKTDAERAKAILSGI
jgi:hypothetical protein